jgi:hypothetical protein
MIRRVRDRGHSERIRFFDWVESVVLVLIGGLALCLIFLVAVPLRFVRAWILRHPEVERSLLLLASIALALYLYWKLFAWLR